MASEYACPPKMGSPLPEKNERTSLFAKALTFATLPESSSTTLISADTTWLTNACPPETTTARGSFDICTRTLTNCPGHSLRLVFGNVALILIVPVV